MEQLQKAVSKIGEGHVAIEWKPRRTTDAKKFSKSSITAVHSLDFDSATTAIRVNVGLCGRPEEWCLIKDAEPVAQVSSSAAADGPAAPEPKSSRPAKTAARKFSDGNAKFLDQI
jgi:hypothetical protein